MKFCAFALISTFVAAMAKATAITNAKGGDSTSTLIEGLRGDVRCETSSKSAGVSNVALAVHELRNKGEDSCYHGGKKRTQMVHRRKS
jgi:hypothetical protein